MPTTLADLQATYPSLKVMCNPDGTGAALGSVNNGKREESLSLLAAWGDREALIKAIIGQRTLYGSGSSATIVATEPMLYPYSDAELYAIAYNTASAGSDATISTAHPWTHVLFNITFGALNWLPNDPSQPYLSRRYRGAGQFITIPGFANEFSSGEKIDADIGKWVGGHSIETTRFQIADLNQFLSIAEPLEGAVNSTAVTIRGRTYAAGYVLFATFAAEEENQGLGQTKATATLYLQYRAIPWNSGVRSDGTVDTYTIAPYATADLNPLLTS